jgi:hypothetical protein
MRCEREIGIIMRADSIAKHRRALQSPAQLYRWTISDSTYVPFSFTSTLLGINFAEFGIVGTDIWAWLSLPHHFSLLRWRSSPGTRR